MKETLESEKQSLISFIWKHHLIIYLAVLIIGLYFDFIHIYFNGVNESDWLGFRYTVDFNFMAILAIFKDAYNEFIQMIKSLFEIIKKETYK